MPTENYENLLKEYDEVVKNIDEIKLKEENHVIEVDIERKKQEIENLGSRIEEIQSDSESLDEIDNPEIISDNGDKRKKVSDLQEDKRKEIAELETKKEDNDKKIRKVKGIGAVVVKKARAMAQKIDKEIEKKIEELKKKRDELIAKTADKNEEQLTPEEKTKLHNIQKEITKLTRERADNKRELLEFIKKIESREQTRTGKKKTYKKQLRKPQKTVTEEKENEESIVQKVLAKRVLKRKTKEERENEEQEAQRVVARRVPKRKNAEERENENENGTGREPNTEASTEQKQQNENEYDLLLEMYNDDLDRLYDYQQQVEEGVLEYSEYEKYADYMVGRYKTIMQEYSKALEENNEEKREKNEYIDVTDEELKNKLEEAKGQLAISAERLEELKGFDEQYAEERATYNEIVLQISKLEKELSERNKNPLRSKSTEQLKINKAELEKQLEASAKRLKELKGFDEQEADERATYSEIVRKISEIDKELESELRKEIEKPEQPMMIIDKEVSEREGANLDNNEYDLLLEMYNEDLDRLYDYQQQVEEGTLEYAEYEKYADYMVERYRFIMEEYGKALERDNEEKREKNEYIYVTDEDLKNKLEAERGKLALSAKRLEELKGFDEQYADERATYSEIVVQISKLEKELSERTKNPLRSISTEQLKINKVELQKQLEASAKRLKELKGFDEQEADERATYSEIVRKISEIDKELESELRKEIEKPEQPMMILDKEEPIIIDTEVDREAMEEEYRYRKQDMVDKYMGNSEKAKEYKERLHRFKEHIVEEEFEYVDENGEAKKGVYKTIEDYEEYENDAFFLQLEEYRERLERTSKVAAGAQFIYRDVKIGDKVITAEEQMQEDKNYVSTYNNAYNSHVHTQKNLMTLGNYGDKLPYSKMQKGQPLRNIIRGVGNATKFVRNHTIAPVSRFVGSKIVAPIHRAIYKPEQSDPNPYRGRITHRYEERKNYFREQGKGYIGSSLSALFKYKEGNRGTLAARGAEIYESIEDKYEAQANKEAMIQKNSIELERAIQDIERIQAQIDKVTDIEEKEALDEKLKAAVELKNRLYRQRDEIQNVDIPQTIQTDAISEKTHDRANKRTITRAVTTVKALAIGATKYFGPKIHKRILERTQQEMISWEKGPDTVMKSKEWVDGNYGEVTVGDYMNGEATATYAVDNVAPRVSNFDVTTARGYAFKNGIDGDGFASFVDGKGMTSAEIARYADSTIPTEFLDAAGNLSSSVKITDIAKSLGVDIKSADDFNNFINNLELCLSDNAAGIPTGWVGNLAKKLGKTITDGHWDIITKVVPGNLIKKISYMNNPAIEKILTLVRKGEDGVIIADVVDQIYQNIRETKGKGIEHRPGRNFEFDDKGLTEGPEGFDYDRKGRNKQSTKKSFIPTYSPKVMEVLSAKSIEELKEKTKNLNLDEITSEEIEAIKARISDIKNREQEATEQTEKTDPTKEADETIK